MSKALNPRRVSVTEANEFGIALYSTWFSTESKKNVMVIERTCDIDYCLRFRIACFEDQAAADVHPADFIRWITEGKYRRIFK